MRPEDTQIASGRRIFLPYRAELHGSGGLLAVIEHTSLHYVRSYITKEWVMALQDGDSIVMIERDGEY